VRTVIISVHFLTALQGDYLIIFMAETSRGVRCRSPFTIVYHQQFKKIHGKAAAEATRGP
jgi:hypothetical protein